MCCLVISIFLYACESQTITAKLEKRTQALPMGCYRTLFNISYKAHITNERFADKPKQLLKTKRTRNGKSGILECFKVITKHLCNYRNSFYKEFNASY